MRSPDGARLPARWLCDVVRVLDALHEAQSKVEVSVATDGSKIYRHVYNSKLIFKEAAVGGSHIFRMKFFDAVIICDEELRRACKSADLKGISFDDPSS